MAKLDPVTLSNKFGFSLFNGFPYLITTVAEAGYHFTLLPGGPPSMLYALALSQYIVNDLPQCLVLRHDCYWHWPDTAPGEGPPLGGTIVWGKLLPFRLFPITDDLASRYDRLARFDGNGGGNILVPDLTEGSRSATAEEIRRLAGKQQNGVPVGLARCLKCGQWKGECLGLIPNFADKVKPVHCLCSNRNFCASCGHPFHRYKLNANYYDEAAGQIRYVPGFMALQHRCPEQMESKLRPAEVLQ